MRCSLTRFTLYRLIRGTSCIYLHAPQCYIKATSRLDDNSSILTLKSTSQASKQHKATSQASKYLSRQLTQASKYLIQNHSLKHRNTKYQGIKLASKSNCQSTHWPRNTIIKLTSKYNLSSSLTRQQLGLLLILSDPRSSLIFKACFRSLHMF